jgi:hypothetical protein
MSQSSRLQVIGYVGDEALPGVQASARLKERMLIALRDCIEDALENQFNVFAQLAISREDGLQIKVNGEVEPELLASIKAAAEQCVVDFKADKLEAFLSGGSQS